MKAALLFYHSVYDEDIRNLIKSLGCVRYVEVPHAWAQDESDQRFGSHIYPGTDAVLLAFVDGPCADKLVESVEHFRSERARQNTHLALIPIERFI